MLEGDREGGLVSASYGEDDISRIEDPGKIASDDEDSGDSSRNSVSISFHVRFNFPTIYKTYVSSF